MPSTSVEPDLFPSMTVPQAQEIADRENRVVPFRCNDCKFYAVPGMPLSVSLALFERIARLEISLAALNMPLSIERAWMESLGTLTYQAVMRQDITLPPALIRP